MCGNDVPNLTACAASPAQVAAAPLSFRKLRRSRCQRSVENRCNMQTLSALERRGSVRGGCCRLKMELLCKRTQQQWKRVVPERPHMCPRQLVVFVGELV